jgi:hypothetical protein
VTAVRVPVVVLTVLAVWFVAATVAVAAGLLARITVPPPAIVAVLAAVTVLAGFLWPEARSWLATVELRCFFLPHLVRFVGIAFLVLVSRGMLVREFIPIGWGDTIAAAGAVILLLTRPRLSTPAGWWSVFAWNCLGLADMAVLIATGIRLGSTAPEQFALFRQLPFGLLPTFFVPLIIASHVFVFRRLFARSAAP